MGCGASVEVSMKPLDLGGCPVHETVKKYSAEKEYTLTTVIGEGGFASVRLGKSKATGEKVAIKEVLKASGANVIQEIEISQFLNGHKHIVEMVESFMVSSRAWIVMKYYPGGNVFEMFVNNSDPENLPETSVAQVMRGLLLALEYCHSAACIIFASWKGIAHMDVKPENILLTSKEPPLHPILSDFGTAVCFKQDPECLDVHRKLLGTASYVAPEVLRLEYHPPHADLWSAGMTLFTMLAGDLAYDGAYHDLTTRRILTAKLVLPYTIVKRRSTASQNFLMSLLRRTPGARPSAERSLTHPWIVAEGVCAEKMDVPEPDDPEDDALPKPPAKSQDAIRLEPVEVTS